MSRRALLSITVAALFTGACGQIVLIGSEGELPAPPPVADGCLKLACGEVCAVATACTANECSSSASGFCDLDGHCAINQPVCPVPDSDPRCAGVLCGTACDPCDPSTPSCTTIVDAGAGNPPLFCDAKQQCQPEPIICP